MCCNLLSEGQVFICVFQHSLFMVVSEILLGFSAASAEFTYTTLILIIWKYYVLFLSLYTQHTYNYLIFINCTNIQFYKLHKLLFLKISTFTRIQNISESDYQLRRVCLSVFRMEWLNPHWLDFHGIEYFLKICQNSTFVKIWQE